MGESNRGGCSRTPRFGFKTESAAGGAGSADTPVATGLSATSAPLPESARPGNHIAPEFPRGRRQLHSIAREMRADWGETGPRPYADLRALDLSCASETAILEQHNGVIGAPEVPVDPVLSVLMELAGPPPLPPRGRLERPGRDGATSQSAGSARRLGPRPDRWEYCWGWSKSTRFLPGYSGGAFWFPS